MTIFLEIKHPIPLKTKYPNFQIKNLEIIVLSIIIFQVYNILII